MEKDPKIVVFSDIRGLGASPWRWRSPRCKTLRVRLLPNLTKFMWRRLFAWAGRPRIEFT